MNEKCPVAIADLVLMYTKPGFVKFCKAHEQRIRTLLPDFRVTRADADDEGDTYINVSGFLAEWTKGKKNLRPLKLDMQFLDHHRKQYLDLHAELSKIDYSPQSEAALTNFKSGRDVIKIKLGRGRKAADITNSILNGPRSKT